MNTMPYLPRDYGRGMIIEAGDGGVSGPSEGQDLEAFYRAMYHCYKCDIIYLDEPVLVDVYEWMENNRGFVGLGKKTKK